MDMTTWHIPRSRSISIFNKRRMSELQTSYVSICIFCCVELFSPQFTRRMGANIYCDSHQDSSRSNCAILWDNSKGCLSVFCLNIAIVVDNRQGRKNLIAWLAVIHIHLLHPYTKFSQEHNMKNVLKSVPWVRIAQMPVMRIL